MYPLKSKPLNIQKALFKGNKDIKKNFKGDYNLFQKQRDIWSSRDSKTVYTNKQGKYSSQRQQLHNKIVNRTVNVKGTVDRKDPDVYFLGGMTASGKTSNLRQRVKEKVVVADPDAVKERLSRVNPSGFTAYPLAHANFLHRESSDVNRQVIERARQEKRDIVIDTTARNHERTKELAASFKRKGYDVHFLGTQKKTPQSIRDAGKRFLSNGRYVPLEFVAANGDSINAAVWNTAHDKSVADSSLVVDTSDGKGDVVYSRGSLTKNYRNPS
jgi:hypothetical protein